MLLAEVFSGVTRHNFALRQSHALEQAASPASYPTTSTGWLMNLAANARTGFCKSMSTVARIDELRNETYVIINGISRPFIFDTLVTKLENVCRLAGDI